MPDFTIILLYPDYLADPYGETWCGQVTAPDIPSAVREAQRQCVADNQFELPDPGDLHDFTPVSIFAGQHEDLVGEYFRSLCPPATPTPIPTHA
jgi:hypothetical protein